LFNKPSQFLFRLGFGRLGDLLSTIDDLLARLYGLKVGVDDVVVVGVVVDVVVGVVVVLCGCLNV
jgi:hypothetical protein